jgi:hypothetical protein
MDMLISGVMAVGVLALAFRCGIEMEDEDEHWNWGFIGGFAYLVWCWLFPSNPEWARYRSFQDITVLAAGVFMFGLLGGMCLHTVWSVLKKIRKE